MLRCCWWVCGSTYRVLVGDVQSVVQPVDGHLQTTVTAAAAAAAALVQQLGAGDQLRRLVAGAGPSSSAGRRTPPRRGGGVDGETVDSVLRRGEVDQLTRPVHRHRCNVM